MNFQVVPANAQAPESVPNRIPTPNELARMAFLHPLLTSKHHAQLVLCINGFCSDPNTVEQLLGSLKAMLEVRARRTQLRRTSPQKVLAQHLNTLRESSVVKAVKSCLRYGAAGGYSMRVELTNDASAIDYIVKMDYNRSTYRGKFKGWKASEDYHTVTVPVDWLTRVLKRGLATIGGMLTLTAQQLVSHGDVELFQATWVEQGRGFQVKVRHGVIARLGYESFHAEDAQKAFKGVLRKVAHAGGGALRTKSAEYGLTTQEFIRRYERYGDLDVHAKDAYRVGACSFGVRSWCHRVGIDIEEGCVPLSRLLAGFAQSPLIEVRRTVLHVVAEHRAWQRLVTKRTAAVEQ